MMNRVMCFTFLFLITFETSSLEEIPEDCGRSPHMTNGPNIQSRIINGNTAKLGQFPWLARLGTIFKGLVHFFCGGSLVTLRFVLTAAHCTELASLVRLGQTFDSESQCEFGVCAPPYQDINVKNYIFEDHCRISFYNDVLLLELEKPATINDFVQPICFPPASLSTDNLIGTNVILAGFGRTNSSDPSLSPDLLHIPLTVKDDEACKTRFPKFDKTQQICLGGNDGQSGCMGDSGGGIIKYSDVDNETRAFVVGIVSYGDSRCNPKTNSVYARVEYFLERIMSNIRSS